MVPPCKLCSELQLFSGQFIGSSFVELAQDLFPSCKEFIFPERNNSFGLLIVNSNQDDGDDLLIEQVENNFEFTFSFRLYFSHQHDVIILKYGRFHFGKK